MLLSEMNVVTMWTSGYKCINGRDFIGTVLWSRCLLPLLIPSAILVYADTNSIPHFIAVPTLSSTHNIYHMMTYNIIRLNYFQYRIFSVVNKDGSQRIGLLEFCHVFGGIIVTALNYSKLLTIIQLLVFQIKLVHQKIMLGNTEVFLLG